VGDFFEAVPGGGDAYVMSRILHDWDDDRDLVILRNCHRAMAEQGKLLVVETVLPPGNEPSLAKFADLTMLAIRVGARERTESEYGDLLAHAGFKLARVIRTAGLHSVLEAVPV